MAKYLMVYSIEMEPLAEIWPEQDDVITVPNLAGERKPSGG